MKFIAWAWDSVSHGCSLMDTNSSASRSPALHALLRLRTCRNKGRKIKTHIVTQMKKVTQMLISIVHIKNIFSRSVIKTLCQVYFTYV